MKAVCCSACGRLTATGDYGKLLIAAADRHRSKPDQEDDRFADTAYDDDPPEMICRGSECLGDVVPVPDFADGFAPWAET